jgi:excisionase family DNA binding protein
MRNPRGDQHDTFLSTAIVARWLGISPRTVCFWAECGEIPALKIGRQWRFREEEIRRWLDTTQDRLLDRRQYKSA